MTDNTSRLDSWKEIAAYLGRDIRTVIRWEAERRLPVRRVPGDKRSMVFAYREELDAWLAHHPATETPAPAATAARSSRPWAPVLLRVGLPVALFVAIALTGMTLKAGRVPVATVSLENGELRALAADGSVVWRHRFTEAVAAPLARSTHVGDIDGDGISEIVTVVKTVGNRATPATDTLYCFSEAGELRWTRTPDVRLRFHEGDYGTPWVSEDLIAFEADGRTRLAWAVRHSTWWPSILFVFDSAGNEQSRFVNSGWIRRLGLSADGRLLMASGITNAAGAHFLASFDSRRVAGRSPELPGSPYECLECGAERPLRYYVLPRTDVSELAAFPPEFAPEIQDFANFIQVRVSQNSERNGPEVLFEFSLDGQLSRARPADSFWSWHRRLRTEGRITHDERDCELRGGMEVREWTAEKGWRAMRLPPP